MPLHAQLTDLLESVLRRERRLKLWCKLGASWTAAAAAGLGLLLFERQIGWESFLALPLVAFLGIATVILVFFRHSKQQPDFRQTACHLEALHPELDGRLLTALEQRTTTGGELNYLQERVLHEALLNAQENDWPSSIPQSRLVFAHAAHWL